MLYGAGGQILKTNPPHTPSEEALKGVPRPKKPIVYEWEMKDAGIRDPDSPEEDPAPRKVSFLMRLKNKIFGSK